MLFFPKKNVRVSIRNKKTVIETKSGVNLYKFLLSEKIIQPTLCGGNGQCGKCKILFLGNNIPKPTYKETLILAKVNIDAGYRLACKHTVKNDIEIDTSEMMVLTPFSPTINDDYPKAIKEPHPPIAELTAPAVEDSTDKNHHAPTEEVVKPQCEEQKEPIEETISISDFKPEATKKRPDTNMDDEGPSDGIFIIQQRGGVRYYCYSASLDNIVTEGFSETDENLKDIIDASLVPDFIHNVLKIRDTDRVLILMEDCEDYQYNDVLNMVKYFKFDIGTLLCEVMMPYGANHDVIRFLRLLNADRNNKLFFSLDMLDRIHYMTKNLITDIAFNSLPNPNILSIFPKGKNPITDFDNNLNIASKENKTADPDGMTLSAFLKAVKLMLKFGIIDNNFTIKPRNDLAKLGLSLSLTVRLTDKNGKPGFYIFSSRTGELILNQEHLYALAQIRSYIVTSIAFVQQRIGNISGLVFSTGANHDDLINLLFDLGFIPREFAEKTVYQTGDSTINAIKLFKEKNMDTFFENNFNNTAMINAADEEIFINIGKQTGLFV
ncbi:MAG: 2Fe-2S iron-sulfur cluster binding domain-containing protein [Deferribacterales bacterium]|nr:2Fe-2S iron-sulfur cluster binding domain-containing protein [Deferribacterales bacterium]